MAFCLAASATYFLNDAADVEADRAHATKRHRPIAAGELPVALATGLAVVLLARRRRRSAVSRALAAPGRAWSATWP